MNKNGIKKRFGDHDIEQYIGLQLRFGVVLASITVLIGGTMLLMRHGHSLMPDYRHFTGTAAGLTTFSEVITGLANFDPKAIIQAGLIILIATPVIRIALSLFGFILEKDRMYTLITIVVLAIMMVSIFGGIKG